MLMDEIVVGVGEGVGMYQYDGVGRREGSKQETVNV